ncbi:Uncharacterised protein [uncultured archaeon]|nr:Uncharacterised protein [uncultured archaeon]
MATKPFSSSSTLCRVLPVTRRTPAPVTASGLKTALASTNWRAGTYGAVTVSTLRPPDGLRSHCKPCRLGWSQTFVPSLRALGK